MSGTDHKPIDNLAAGRRGFSDTLIERLWSAGYETYSDLDGASKSDLTEIDGIGPKRAEKIKRTVERSLRTESDQSENADDPGSGQRTMSTDTKQNTMTSDEETIPLDEDGDVRLPVVELLTGRGLLTGKSGS